MNTERGLIYRAGELDPVPVSPFSLLLPLLFSLYLTGLIWSA